MTLSSNRVLNLALWRRRLIFSNKKLDLNVIFCCISEPRNQIIIGLYRECTYRVKKTSSLKFKLSIQLYRLTARTPQSLKFQGRTPTSYIYGLDHVAEVLRILTDSRNVDVNTSSTNTISSYKNNHN